MCELLISSLDQYFLNSAGVTGGGLCLCDHIGNRCKSCMTGLIKVGINCNLNTIIIIIIPHRHHRDHHHHHHQERTNILATRSVGDVSMRYAMERLGLDLPCLILLRRM